MSGQRCVRAQGRSYLRSDHMHILIQKSTQHMQVLVMSSWNRVSLRGRESHREEMLRAMSLRSWYLGVEDESATRVHNEDAPSRCRRVMPCSKYYNAPSSTLDTSTPFKYCNASPSSPDVSACEAMMMMMVRGRNAIWVPRFLPLSLLNLHRLRSLTINLGYSKPRLLISWNVPANEHISAFPLSIPPSWPCTEYPPMRLHPVPPRVTAVRSATRTPCASLRGRLSPLQLHTSAIGHA
jgi:hypothetical protein